MDRLTKHIIILCFFMSVIYTQAQASYSQEKLKSIAYSQGWLRLLHYGKHGDEYLSRLDGKQFFFAEDGKTNPLNELQASIDGLNKNLKIGRLKLHPLCAFPERKRFIEQHVGVRYPKRICQKFEEFIARFKNPQSVSLVFSSAYPNNPASMFGHTFIKVKSSRKSELLDMGINFAAWTPQDINMLVFMYKGVAGGYPGIWSMEPYYKKVNEYINSESRDLWEYKLSLNKSEILRLLAHFWELEVSSYFDYYFFDENCSYQVLKAVEAIKLDWNVTDHTIYVIPGETVKNIMMQKGAVTEVKFRPSLYHQAQLKLAGLSKVKQKSALNWMKKIEDADTSPEVLSAALTGTLYYKSKKKNKWSKSDQAWENRLLTLTAKRAKTKNDLVIPEYLKKTRPDIGHDPYALFYSAGAYSNEDDQYKGMAKFKLRTSYHDMLANDQGYAPFSEIEFPWFEVMTTKNSLKLMELGGLNTRSLFPLSSLDKRKSWRVKLAGFRETIDPCKDCFIATAEVGIGATLGDKSYRFYTMAILASDFHHQLNKGYRLQPGVELGHIHQVNSHYKLSLNYQYLHDDRNKLYTNIWNFTQSYHVSRHQELRLELKKRRNNFLIDNFHSEMNFQFIQYFR